MNPDKIVCHCLGVTNGMIKDVIDGGSRTLEEVQEATGAGTACGVCLENVENLVKSLVAEQEK